MSRLELHLAESEEDKPAVEIMARSADQSGAWLSPPMFQLIVAVLVAVAVVLLIAGG